jgi:hypothetical protein
MPAVRIRDHELEKHIAARRTRVRKRSDGEAIVGAKKSSVAREITHIKAISNWATRRRPRLILFI